ncbi:MAG: restriction endonuclease subunit S [Bacteroidales bacterium]|jgi:hypothetical protein|nr:restriction endonuclease subunit S [Bacteroidales bacterium]
MQNELLALEKKHCIDWRKVKLERLFDITGTKSLDAGKLTFVDSGINFIGRTFEFNGIQGKIIKQNFEPNAPFTITATVIGNYKYVKYQKEPYYVSQNINKLTPKFNINEKLAKFFMTYIQNFVSQYDGQQSGYKLDEMNNYEIDIPYKGSEIAFDYIEEFIATLEAERLATLEAYLTITNLKDYILTSEEVQVLADIDKVEWREFKIVGDIFTVKNTHNILSRYIVENSGNTPYLTASNNNNAVGTYIEFEENLIDEGNSIFIGGKTFVVTYQEKDYFSNDSHNLALYLKESEKRTKLIQLFLVTTITKSLSPLYSWGDSISNKKIQKDIIILPVKSDHTPDYAFMSTYIKAMQKIVIKNVVEWADKRIEKTKEVVEKMR